MGLETKSQSDKTFVSLLGEVGFTVKCNQAEEGAVERTKKNGEKVYEKVYDKLSGKLTRAEAVKKEINGKELRFFEFDFEDGQTYTLSMNYSSRMTTSLLKFLPNVDLSKEVTFGHAVGKDGKPYLWCAQGDDIVRWAYTKENPNGLPQMKQVEFKGELVWDDTAMMAYLEDMVNNLQFPKADDLPF